MLDDLYHLPRSHRHSLTGIDLHRRIIIAINLAALDLLQPAIVSHLGHVHALRWVRVQHGQEDASERRRIDVVVEEGDVGVI